ncbi:hypothetical protein KDX27_39505 [Burkholderia cenocepacia]|uniref:hypothetical protein n=1 Tax=Burkholderia TaxID=32008 RepID=UPI000AACA800|nr:MULTISPECIES: hypothetical protein [Burkholderia]MBJ9695637.1 hypothetical protein [Burkholderia cenocepacia]MBN3533168.1 hypothetical protein [Burkholderia cenocepacia]MBO1855632.1 hypothetical protein [Burkholderia cenocepacia]MBR8029937.1 hypothetical protein [Burkholderia cenocepacia]MBR8173780.1 hypothetical protein [Burkholderia cenocepacia]
MKKILILADSNGAQLGADTKTHVHQPGPLLGEIHARVRLDDAVFQPRAALLSASP